LNAIEIEQAVSKLAEEPFDAAGFPYFFLAAFGNKETTIKRLRAGASNKSDLGGVLQVNNIHILACADGEVSTTLKALRDSFATAKAKAKFILATDGKDFEAEDLVSGDTLSCAYHNFPDRFGFFLSLAGINPVQQIRESAFDIRATSRLNKLYVELRENNPDWDKQERRPDMNHFMARLIFCFFAEDTSIFPRDPAGPLFTLTVERMSERDASNTHEIIETLFLAMNTKQAHRRAAGVPHWADAFPYVNGGLFGGTLDVPRFNKIARSYLLHIGGLDWTKINPDIFGSMIQAVADEEERGALGLHYTSVPNILKVLSPLFLDDLRSKLQDAGDNARALLNLRRRISRIRVFDPACGSGNFLVIAYKEMRAIEAGINGRRNEPDRRSDIPLTNFRGIELRDFAAEIARLALIIAEYQCDVLYRGQKLALVEFLPLEAQNWITCGNALRLDWKRLCPPVGKGVQLQAEDLFDPVTQAEIDFENEGGETYICGNPPYVGRGKKSPEQQADMEDIFGPHGINHGHLDYVSCWFAKAVQYGQDTLTASAFVATNSVCQGSQVPLIWPLIFGTGAQIIFAYPSFRWSNLATYNAGVTVVIVGISSRPTREKYLYFESNGEATRLKVANINAYLIGGDNVVVEKSARSISELGKMDLGSMAKDGGYLIMSASELRSLKLTAEIKQQFIRPFYGSEEVISGVPRYCLWITDEDAETAWAIPSIAVRLRAVLSYRSNSTAASTRGYANRAHRFIQIAGKAKHHTLIVPRHSSEARGYLPCGIVDDHCTAADSAFAIYDGPMWNLAVLVSKLHLVWIATVCGKLETRYRYSSVSGWNTFPVPALTDKNKADLGRTAEEILVTREAYFPASIADLYDPQRMPADLKEAHERNDEVLERIYIGRRFKTDTERLEKLFELYTKMTSEERARGGKALTKKSKMLEGAPDS